MTDWSKIKTIEQFKEADPMMYEILCRNIVNNHCANGALEYVLFGTPMGHFLTYLFENDLVNAYGHADTSNTEHLREWAAWLFNSAPADCWGSEEKVLDWQSRGGLVGWMREKLKEAEG